MEESAIDKETLQWSDVEGLVAQLADRLRDPANFDAILCITRGGMIPGCLLSEKLGIRNIMVAAVMFFEGPGKRVRRPFFWQFPADELLLNKRVLVVDDIWSDGRMAMAVKIRVVAAGGRPEVAVLHYRPEFSEFPNEGPDYSAVVIDRRWFVYPWDKPNRGKSG